MNKETINIGQIGVRFLQPGEETKGAMAVCADVVEGDAWFARICGDGGWERARGE
jgi:hypothetical protein